jgi:hypothetical protein
MPQSGHSRPAAPGQLRSNAAITTDNVVTLGAGYHGACSGELTGYQAVPSQRAIGVGNFLGNSKSPTVLRILIRLELAVKVRCLSRAFCVYFLL